MKYTRYDFKKSKKDRIFLLIIIVLVVILAFIIGTVISNTFIKNSKTIKNKNNPVINSKCVINGQEECIKFIAIQGGVFSTLDNVSKHMNTFNQLGVPFTIQEGKNVKIILGIYTEDEGKKQMQKLKDKNVAVSKIDFILCKDNLCNAEIAEIINANVKILNKLLEENVEAIETEELKKWCNSLEKVDSKSENIKILNDLKDYIKKMPKKISKQDIKGNYVFIFNILKKIKAN